MKHRPHVRSGIATRSPSHEGRGDDTRRSVGDVSSDPRFRVTYFERGVPSVQSSGLDASRQAARPDGKIVLPEDDEAAEMLADVALFEPNQRGRRAFDTFLGGKALQLEAGDFELARRTGDAFFSLFRFSARHEVAGVWLEDLLAGNRRLWLMDESMEASASKDVAFGMRVFDAGEFHVGFGIAAPSDDETTEFTVRTPFRHSLAVTLYGDSL